MPNQALSQFRQPNLTRHLFQYTVVHTATISVAILQVIYFAMCWQSGALIPHFAIYGAGMQSSCGHNTRMHTADIYAPTSKALMQNVGT